MSGDYRRVSIVALWIFHWNYRKLFGITNTEKKKKKDDLRTVFKYES